MPSPNPVELHKKPISFLGRIAQSHVNRVMTCLATAVPLNDAPRLLATNIDNQGA